MFRKKIVDRTDFGRFRSFGQISESGILIILDLVHDYRIKYRIPNKKLIFLLFV